MNKSNRPVQGLGDLTLIVTIDRHVRLPLSKWRGHGVGFCSWLMKAMVFQIKTYPTLSS